MTKLRALIAAGIVLGATALSTLPANAAYCYYEYLLGWLGQLRLRLGLLLSGPTEPRAPPPDEAVPKGTAFRCERRRVLFRAECSAHFERQCLDRKRFR